MSNLTIGALVLAGGKGTRMHSSIPKVLQKILGEPLLRYVYDALYPVCGNNIWTIVGHKAEMVEQAFPEHAGKLILQMPQLGTGHALQTAWDSLCKSGITHVLVVNGDTPQLDTHQLNDFLTAIANAERDEAAPDIAFISLELQDPASFGRVVRKNGKPAAIIEAKDYNPALHGENPREVNAGIYCFCLKTVGSLLPQLSNNNKNNEYYITDLIALGEQQGLVVESVTLSTTNGMMGVNTPAELLQSEEEIRQKIVNRLLKQGVFLRSPQNLRIGPHVTLAPGVDITGPSELYGQTSIGAECIIHSHCKIVDSQIGEHVQIQSYSYLQQARVNDSCTIGPFARLRPGAMLQKEVHIGNFVEVKKSVIGSGTKINHLSYIGDAEIGENTNIGAGTITCNYDGTLKHVTRIGSKAFIGSNTCFIAPVSVGDDALIGAGSVITKNVENGTLALSRAPQLSLPKKKK